MVQRVGIAQALINDPEVVFLDEPMSGLDPLGRRDVRELILELRDQGARSSSARTSWPTPRRSAAASPSSPADGWRVGRLTDILAFEVRGWELVMAGLTPEVLARLGRAPRATTEIRSRPLRARAAARPPPEQVLAELTAAGAQLVSLNPMRETLEDFFVRRVAEAGVGRDGTGKPEGARARD